MTSTTEPQSPSDPGWVSRVCIAWVIDDAPCPTELFPVLATIARRCNNDGTGSYQSKATMAKRTGKSRDQVDADVKRLLELGLIRLGDQSLLDDTKIPEWQRPKVYDVALEMRGDKPMKAGRNKNGKNKRTDPPGMDTPGGTDTPPGTDTPTPGGTDTSSPGGTDTPQISLSKNPLNNPSSLSARTSVPPPRDPAAGERDESTSSEDPNLTPQQQLVIKNGCPPHLALHVVDFIEATNTINSLGWWYTADSNGSLRTQVAAALVELAKPIGGDPDSTTGPHCPTCQDTGKLTVRLMYEGDSEKTIDCDDCTNNGRGKCRHHPGQPAHNCGACRGDRIAATNQQGRRRERPNANASNASDWLTVGRHEPYRNYADHEYLAWEGNHHLLEPAPEAAP
ncbi:helix-turn-helix domain-containing protein [Micromonospora sp. NPDC000207]|uniref:helix-turn-helix domain-containing protein n=1 Tax=Micromonospora sp. NPDC000207 TaxID=3154246 RepID=UPI003325DB9D